MESYEVYRKAAGMVDAGWIQGQLVDSNGNVCLVGSIQRTLGRPVDAGNVMDVHARLMAKSRLYRLMTMAAERAGYGDASDVLDRIQAWNDMPLRRKRSVVAVLSDLADTKEREWLVDQRSKLLIEVTNLRERVRQLEVRVARLEADNAHLLKRIANRRTYRDDTATLEALSAELDAKQRHLETMMGDGRDMCEVP